MAKGFELRDKIQLIMDELSPMSSRVACMKTQFTRTKAREKADYKSCLCESSSPPKFYYSEAHEGAQTLPDPMNETWDMREQPISQNVGISF